MPADAEDTRRIAAEEARRVAAEEARRAAEDVRIVAEAARKTAEDARASTKNALRNYSRKATAGFLVLLVAVGYVVYDTTKTSRDADALLAESRVSVIKSLCSTDNELAVSLRRILDGQIEFVRENPERPPPTLEQRVDAIRALQSGIPIPDCNAVRMEVEDTLEAVTE